MSKTQYIIAGASPNLLTPPTFKFQVVYDAPGTFTLPILEGGSGYVHNFTVNWGDGTPDSTVTSYNDPDRIHTYAAAGTYNITMTGTCKWFAFNNAGDKTKITKLLAFTGDMGFKKLQFYGCSNLNTLVPLGIKASLTFATSMYRGCPSITSIPNGNFDGCPNITNFVYVFDGDILITSIPDNLFKYNVLATIFAYAFRNTGITSIPIDLFKYNILATAFSYTFYGDINILIIPLGIFDYNVLVTDVDRVFSGDTGITSELDEDIFLNCLVLVNFEESFKDCINMIGKGQPVIDNTALPGHSVPTTTTGCFNGCTGLTDYATIPAAWGGGGA